MEHEINTEKLAEEVQLASQALMDDLISKIIDEEELDKGISVAILGNSWTTTS